VDGFDATTWQAIGVTLTVVGLVLSVLVGRRRGVASGLRAAGWSLLPAAAGLTGTLRLLAQIGEAVVTWATRLVFSPVVWAGVAIAGVALVLLGVSAAMRSRGVGAAGRRALPADAAAAAAPAGAATPRPARGRTEPAVQDKDMDDIEAILRKHGIQ
jgi:heme exporter protein D